MIKAEMPSYFRPHPLHGVFYVAREGGGDDAICTCQMAWVRLKVT